MAIHAIAVEKVKKFGAVRRTVRRSPKPLPIHQLGTMNVGINLVDVEMLHWLIPTYCSYSTPTQYVPGQV